VIEWPLLIPEQDFYFMTDLKPIQTRYNGYNFRSRLEARWAVFLDEMNIDYEYEHEGFDLNGIWYLPDFWLPTFNGECFLEVKPTALNKTELEKAKRLCFISHKPIILAIGSPNYKSYEILLWGNSNGVEAVYSMMGLINCFKAENENRLFFEPGFEPTEKEFSTTYINAVKTARGQRF
jgi:hypothetical protein